MNKLHVYLLIILGMQSMPATAMLSKGRTPAISRTFKQVFPTKNMSIWRRYLPTISWTPLASANQSKKQQTHNKNLWAWALPTVPAFAATWFTREEKMSDEDTKKVDFLIKKLKYNQPDITEFAQIQSTVGRQTVISYATDHFDELIKSKNNIKFLKQLMELDSTAAVKFIQPTVNNFTHLKANGTGCTFLVTLANSNATTAQTFSDLILSDLKVYHDNYSFGRLMKSKFFQEAIINNICKNFVTFVDKDENRHSLLHTISHWTTELEASLLQKLAQVTFDNLDTCFNTLAPTFYGEHFLINLALAHDTVYAHKLLTYAQQKPKIFFNKTKDGFYLLKSLINDSTVTQIVDLIKSNFDKFNEYHDKQSLTIKLAQQSLDAAQKMTALTIEHLNQYSNTSDVVIAGLISLNNTDITQQIADALTQPEATKFLEHLAMIKDGSDNYLFSHIVNPLRKLNPEFNNKINDLTTDQKRLELAIRHLNRSSTKIFIECIKKNDPVINQYIADTLAQPRAQKYLEEVIKDNFYDLWDEDKKSATFENFFNPLKVLNAELAQRVNNILSARTSKRFSGLNPSLFHGIVQKIPCNPALLQKINEGVGDKDATFQDIVKKMAYLETCVEDRERVSLTTTEQHILKNFKEINYDRDSILDKTLHALHVKARTLENNGYTTFVHGQRLNNLLVEDWFTRLHELKDKKAMPEFLFAHVKDIETSEKENLRKKLLRNGRFSENDRAHLLFLNYALLGNSTNPGSSTYRYIKNDSNVGPQYAYLKDAFKTSGYKDVYTKYKPELTQLEKEFDSLSYYGNALLIAVPQDKLSQCVYSARSGGYKKPIYIEGVGETEDINLIMHTLKHEPDKIHDTDQIEFCLIMTSDKDGGLNPESGIKVYPFMTPKDEQKYAEFKNKEEQLWKKIEADIKSRDN